MKFYRDLNLKSIMDAENLDFAHWTFGKNQCSCCYGPFDMPARYWKNGIKPGKRFTSIDHRSFEYVRGGEPITSASIRYILFKNAHNGSGAVTEDDIIKDYTCISYQLVDLDQVKRICQLLRAQLDDDYVVVEPENTYTCIIIRLKGAMI